MPVVSKWERLARQPAFHRAPLPSTLRSACAWVLWSAWLMIPWTPRTFATEPLDAASTIFSHIAFTEGAPWGATALHTSGPLGFLRFPVFYEPTYVLLLVGNGAIAATAALLLYEIARPRLSLWARVPFVIVATWVLSVSDDAVWLFLLLVSQILVPEVTRSPAGPSRPTRGGWLGRCCLISPPARSRPT